MNDDDRSAYEKVAAEIRRRISLGTYRAGAPIPSVPSLAVEFDVAGATIQKAQKLLKEEGYLVAQRGAHVMVRLAAPLVVGSAAYIQPEPERFTYEIIDVTETVPPPRVAAALGTEPTDVAVLRHRLMRFDGKPVEISWSYYPADLARGTALARRAKVAGGAQQTLTDIGVPPRTMTDRISIRPPAPDERVALDLPKGISVLQQFRVICTDGGKPVEVSILVKGGNQYELENVVTVE